MDDKHVSADSTAYNDRKNITLKKVDQKWINFILCLTKSDWILSLFCLHSFRSSWGWCSWLKSALASPAITNTKNWAAFWRKDSTKRWTTIRQIWPPKRPGIWSNRRWSAAASTDRKTGSQFLRTIPYRNHAAMSCRSEWTGVLGNTPTRKGASRSCPLFSDPSPSWWLESALDWPLFR